MYPTKSIKANPVSIFLKSNCKEEVSKIIMHLKNSSPGWDNFQSNVVEDTSDIL